MVRKTQWRIVDWTRGGGVGYTGTHFYSVQVKPWWSPIWFKRHSWGIDNMHHSIPEAEAYIANKLRKAPAEERLQAHWWRRRVYKKGIV